MAASFRTVFPSDEGSADALYGTLVRLVVPRPIALVSTVSANGAPNLAPFSFFMLGGADPPSLALSPLGRGAGRPKDTLNNIRDTGEFVVNLVDRPVAEAMNRAALDVAPEVDEWDLAELTALPSLAVRPARVAECKVQFECVLYRIVPHGVGARSANYVIGEIVRAHVADAASQDWRPIARMGGSDYLDTDTMERFTLVRPKA